MGKLLVIHVDTSPDTGRFAKMWKDVDAVVIRNPEDKMALYDVIKEHNGPILFCGHGSPEGLFAPDMSSYIVDDSFTGILQKKKVIGIWCHAAQFAEKHNLHGFFTSMFISNSHEARMFGMTATEDAIKRENIFFCYLVHSLLIRNIALCNWRDYIASLYSSVNITETESFNLDGLCSVK